MCEPNAIAMLSACSAQQTATTGATIPTTIPFFPTLLLHHHHYQQQQQQQHLFAAQPNPMDEDSARDRTHLSLNLAELKPRDESEEASGLSPIQFPTSLLDAQLLLSPEKFLLAAKQQHQQSHLQLLQQQQQNNNNNNSQFQQTRQKPDTPTPSRFFSSNVTRDQESFAEGFVEALQRLQATAAAAAAANNNNNNTLQQTQDGQTPTSGGTGSSPSTIKFLLSLAALTPTSLSPSSANKPLVLGQQQHSPNNNTAAAAAAAVAVAAANILESNRRLEVPKIVLNNNETAQVGFDPPLPPPTLAEGLANSAAATSATNDIARRYMDYLQLGVAQIGQQQQSPTAGQPPPLPPLMHSSLVAQVPQQHFPGVVPAMGILPQLQPQPKPFEFIKKEPTHNGEMDTAQPPVVVHQMAPQMNGVVQQAAVTSSEFHPMHGTRNRVHPTVRSHDVEQQHGDQDVRKLERKRARNRLAASKCRQRKLQRISDLEQQVNEERERGAELQEEIVRLKIVIKGLTEQLHKGQQQNGADTM